MKFPAETAHNRRLSAFMVRLEAEAEAAHSQTELVEVVRLTQSFGAPLSYDNRLPVSLGAGATLILVGMGLYAYVNQEQWQPAVSSPPFSLWVLGIPAFCAVVCFAFAFLRSQSISTLSDTLFEKDFLADNGLTRHTGGPAVLTAQVGNRFREFRRGNHKREITALLSGIHEGSEHSFPFDCYTFHYVNKRRVTNSKGRTRTVYDHYYRYGLIVPFSFARDLMLTDFGGIARYPARYKSASNRFNKTFTVSAADEMIAARFLNPSIVVAIEEMSETLKQLNYEFNSEGELCLSFADDDLVQLDRQFGLDDPDNFIAELEAANKLDKLHHVLEHIDRLLKYSDSNF